MKFTKTTEQSSKYNHLEKMSVSELLQNINNEDKTVQENLEKQALDLAKLSQNLLKGEALTAFVKRSFEMIK